MQPPEAQQLTVPEGEAGKRLDVFLADTYPEYSRAQWRHAINSKRVLVDGQRRKAAYRLRSREQITAEFPERFREEPVAEAIPLEVLFEDEHLAAINKPPGMVVHPARGHWSGTLTSALAYHFGQLSQIGGPARPGIVHRLDRDTSGVILVAKTDRAHLGLSRQFERRELNKQYLAICRGTCDRDRDQIDLPIGVHPYQREKMAIRRQHVTTREASTYYEVLERLRGFLVMNVFPKTGRTHQIRVHLAHLGCPIVSDPLYAGHSRLLWAEVTDDRHDHRVLMDRLALHASRIEIVHPIHRQKLEITAPLPADLQGLIAALRQWR